MLAADGVLCLLILFLHEVLAQTTHVVNVGVEGSFYSPPTVSAGLNDTVMFVFGGDAHTVTQSSFESPCVRLDGGFDSGFNGRGPDFSQPPSVWTLRITNVSETIWYFCEASIPTSHCESGMVGAINPPSIPVYQQFVSAAKLVTSTPKRRQHPPVASGGSSNSHLSLIAGCATAGGIIILILIVLTVFHCRRWRAYQNHTSSPNHNQATTGMYKPHVLTSADGSTAATAPTFTGVTRTPLLGALPYRDRDRDDAEKSTDGAAPGSPGSRSAIRPLPRTPSHNQLHHQAGVDGGGNVASADPHTDINALAMEVASVLLNTPPRPGARQHPANSSLRNNNSTSNVVRNNHKRVIDDSGSGWYNESGESDETDPDRHSTTAPPHYRAT
ncbi:hypothetical protein MVEN_01658700 [Mycena venus]|uniref:Extracellular serine-rich protein n=1 Tax=Mycena venus TaxID=2733690 RepID=A0A8H6XRE1_9AGAR|nr:hypothetical protein MVEN_01658700 [Mycena venus]